MKRNSGLANKKTRAKLSFVTIGALVLCCVIFCVAAFVNSNEYLSTSIQNERMDYVKEISNQIIASQRFIENSYNEAVVTYAGILNSVPVFSLEDARNFLSGKDASMLMLASTSGGIMDLNGKHIYLSDRKLLLALREQTGVIRMFTSLGGAGDCWVFATHIQPLMIDRAKFDVLVLAVPADEFRNNLVVSLFDNRGASFLIRRDGSIDIKPLSANNAFSGYNLFASMTRLGASDADMRELMRAVESRMSGSMLIVMESEEWLISFDSISDENAIIVAVPLAFTAADTYDGLNDVILYATVIVVLTAILLMVIVFYFLYRDRERRAEIMAAEAKSDFFSKMSHDIRTPLNAIIGLQTLAKDTDDVISIRGYLAQSTSAAEYLLSIINDVLDMSRIGSGKLTLASEPFELGALITDTASLVASMAAEKGIKFSREGLSEINTYYLGDSVRIRQVLVNLLNNAVKYTEPGGSIWLTVKRKALSGARDEITLILRDTGIGMSKQFLSRVFTPFEQERPSYTTQYTGSGLGLSIVHSLVKLMGGRIEVKSQQGKGTVFSVTLTFTRTDKPAEELDKRSALPSRSYTGKRVLLAEDNEINKQIAIMLLKRRFDIDAEAAPDGAETLRMFELSQIDEYDMILMDVKMPNMDGLEATRRIRALDRDDAKRIPIVALSANAFAEDVALSLTAGMNAHLSKPLDVTALAAVLEKYMG